MTDQQLDAVLQKQHNEKIARWKLEGVDHSDSERVIAQKWHLLIHL